MFHYICKDLTNALRYLPFGIGAGVLCFSVLVIWNGVRGRRQKERISVVPRTLFFTYLAVIMAITFFSRESGSRQGLDLEFLSTWGINDRNNAYVIENILLFIPYGVLCPVAFRRLRKFWSSLLTGALTSLFVESLQLLTGRGYFQIDDILTNILGTAAGYLLYFVALQCQKGFRGKHDTR